MRWKVGRDFIHEEQEFQLPVSRLLRQHPIVQFTRELLDKILLLIFVLNGVQVDDVERDFSGNRRLDEGSDVDGDAVGKQQLIDTGGKCCQAAGEVVAR